jgi:cytidylate kinase
MDASVSESPLNLHPAIIAIDGPAASGKSTIGHMLAERIGYLFFDSGIMYRAVTAAALQRGLDPNDDEAISNLTEEMQLDILPPGDANDGRQNTVMVDDLDITPYLRGPAIDRNVSIVSAVARVRQALMHHQRKLGLRYGAGDAELAGIIMVGRDIGTSVLPEAPLKVYLDATARERAHRRFLEMQEKGKEIPFDEVYQDILARDALDSGREISPLRAADDAVWVDTTSMTPEEVVEKLLELAGSVTG